LEHQGGAAWRTVLAFPPADCNRHLRSNRCGANPMTKTAQAVAYPPFVKNPALLVLNLHVEFS